LLTGIGGYYGVMEKIPMHVPEEDGENLKESYFKNIDKKIIDEVVDTLISLKEYNPIIHTDNSIKKIIEDKLSSEDKIIINDDSYFSDESHLEDMIKKNVLARIDDMVLSPGNEGFFQIEYMIKKDKKIIVGFEATDAQKSGFDSWDFTENKAINNRLIRELKKEDDDENMVKMFKKFTGHSEPYEIDLSQLKDMFANNKKVAESLKKEVEKTIEELGEVTSYRDFISRINIE
jgi:hypothetical protein